MARYTGKPGSASVAIQEIASIDSRYTNRCLYSTPGCSTFTVPGGVNSVLAVAVGPGSKACEGLKCARLLSCANIAATLETQFRTCCCVVKTGNCCYPDCCGQSNTVNFSCGSWIPVNVQRRMCYTLSLCPFQTFSCNCWGSGNLCCSQVCFYHMAWGDYVYQKVPGGMGGGYSEKVISVTPSQSLDVVVGCWNCIDSFSSVTANSSVSICATGPKVCRSSTPVVNGPYKEGNVLNHSCHWESLLNAATLGSSGLCGLTCKCCGTRSRSYNCTYTWGWLNDFQNCFVPGCGYGGDINRKGGGTVFNICKTVTQHGQDHPDGFGYCGAQTPCIAHCFHGPSRISCGGVCCGPIPDPCNLQYEAIMCTHAQGCYSKPCCLAVTSDNSAVGGRCGFAGTCKANFYCASPVALATCHHQFISVHPLLGSECVCWQAQKSAIHFFGGGCNCLSQTCTGAKATYSFDMCLSTTQKILGSGGGITYFNCAPCVENQANTPGYLNIFSLCNCQACPGCFGFGDHNFSGLMIKIEQISHAQSCSYTDCTCAGTMYPASNYIPNSRMILSNSLATADERTYRFGGSSAGNYYSNGVNSTSDATYGQAATVDYNHSLDFQNLNDNSAAFQCFDHVTYCNAECGGSSAWYCKRANGCSARGGYAANNFTVANGEELYDNEFFGKFYCNCCKCGGCTSEVPYLPHFPGPCADTGGLAQACGCFCFTGCHYGLGRCASTTSFPGHIYAPHLNPQTVRGFESTAAVCCYDRFSCHHAGDEIMCGYEFFLDCYCCDNFAVKQNLYFPFPIAGGSGYGHPFENPLNNLKGDHNVVFSAHKLYPSTAGQVYGYFNCGLKTASGSTPPTMTCSPYLWCQVGIGCTCIGHPDSGRFVPPQSTFKYYANTIYAGHPVRCTVDGCAVRPCVLSRHDLSSVVLTMKNGCLCGAGCTCCDGIYCTWTAPSVTQYALTGCSHNCDQSFCISETHRIRAGVDDKAYWCNNLYWPHCQCYNALTANTNDNFHNCTGVSCGKNSNPLLSTFDFICIWQTFKGNDDQGKPCIGMASAMSDGYANAQVYLHADNRAFCKEMLGPNMMPFSHRTIPFLVEGHCGWDNTCYLSNTGYCAFRTPDKVTICDSDFYYQFIHNVCINTSWCQKLCHQTFCMCCACCNFTTTMFMHTPTCLTRTPTGGSATHIEELEAQGGAGTGTAGNWSSTTGGTGGVITDVAVTTKGTGYKSTPFICVSGGGGGTGAVLEPIMHLIANNTVCCAGTTAMAPGVGFDTGCVVGVRVVCGGTGYTCAPTLTVCGGGTSTSNPITQATLSATVSSFVANKSFGSGGGSIEGNNPTDVSVTDTTSLVSVVPGRGGKGCEPPNVPYFSSYPGIETTVTDPPDPSAFVGDAATSCDWFDTKQIRGSGGNGCFTSGAFGSISTSNPGPGGGGAVGCDSIGNLIGCGGVLAGGSGCGGTGGYGGGAGYGGTPGNGLVVIYWNA